MGWSLWFRRPEWCTWSAQPKDGAVAKARSPNKLNSFWVQVEPEQEHGTFIDEDRGMPISFDEHRNVLVDYNRKTEGLNPEVLQAIIAGFEYACHAGPLVRRTDAPCQGKPNRHGTLH